MSLATLDTHEVVKDLRSAGFTDEQAAAVARNLRKAQDLDTSSLATKSDLLATRSDLKDEIGKVHDEVEKVRGEVDKLRGEVDKFRVEIGKDIAETKVDILKYMFGTIGFQTLTYSGPSSRSSSW